jgi:hypothetical protein
MQKLHFPETQNMEFEPKSSFVQSNANKVTIKDDCAAKFHSTAHFPQKSLATGGFLLVILGQWKIAA